MALKAGNAKEIIALNTLTLLMPSEYAIVYNYCNKMDI